MLPKAPLTSRPLSLWFSHNLLTFKKKARSAKRRLRKALAHGLDTSAVSLAYHTADAYLQYLSILDSAHEEYMLKLVSNNEGNPGCLFKLL